MNGMYTREFIHEKGREISYNNFRACFVPISAEIDHMICAQHFYSINRLVTCRALF